jgi:hypothetical protein
MWKTKVKPLAGETKNQKRKIFYWEVVVGGKLYPCSKNTWPLNIKPQAFLSPVHLLLMSLKTQGSLVMTLTSEIILLQWEGQETACMEITSAQLKRTST